MNLSVGIVGLPNVGKSTLFNALRSAQGKLSGLAQVANYPFTTIEPNVGVVEVPDERLEKLANMIARTDPSPVKPDQDDKAGKVPPIVPAIVKFVDIAGLVKGAAKGEGLGNQFLSHIREVDAIVFVLRDFKNPDIIQTGENPNEDLEVLKSELLLKDLETIEKRLGTFIKEIRNVPDYDPRVIAFNVLENAKKLVEQGKWLGETMDGEELEKIADLQLLSAKKTIYVLNSDEGDLKEEIKRERDPLRQRSEASKEIKSAIRISAKLESELAELGEEEQKEYMKELGIEEPGLNKLIGIAYETLGLATFFTAGPKEVRAWTIRRGALAPEAAGAIHTDFQKGFIAAEVIDWQKLVEAGGWQRAKTAGLIKTIGKSEEIKDGYVVEFRFNI